MRRFFLSYSNSATGQPERKKGFSLNRQRNQVDYA